MSGRFGRKRRLSATAAQARAASPVVPAGSLVYRAFFAGAGRLEPVEREGAVLPRALVIDPGAYAYGGLTWEVDEPGVYRFWSPSEAPSQRIVVGDGRSLMSAIAWITTHGSADDAFSDAELEETAQTRNVLTTCGVTARFAETLGRRLGFEVRRVSITSRSSRNGFDDDHVLVELKGPRGWELHDLDRSVAFEHEGRPLSVQEAIRRAPEFDLVPLAAGAGIDTHFASSRYAFYNEFFAVDDAARKAWYAHVLGAQKPIDL